MLNENKELIEYYRNEIFNLIKNNIQHSRVTQKAMVYYGWNNETCLNRLCTILEMLQEMTMLELQEKVYFEAEC